MNKSMRRTMEIALGIAGGIVLTPVCVAAVVAVCY